MAKFNKILSQLEAIYGLENHVLEYESPDEISKFIHVVFENSQKYGLGNLNKSWFDRYSNTDPIKATNLIYNILQEQGEFISKKCIFESITEGKYNESKTRI